MDKSDKSRRFIIPLDRMTSMLNLLCRDFLTPRDIPLPNYRKFNELVVAMVDDSMNQRMEWATNTECVNKVLSSMFDWYDADPKFASEFYLNAIDPVEAMVDDICSAHMGSTTWYVWNRQNLRNMIAVSGEDDFRIIDWQRRTASGEWK